MRAFRVIQLRLLLKNHGLKSAYFLTVQQSLLIDKLFKISSSRFCLLHAGICREASRFRCNKSKQRQANTIKRVMLKRAKYMTSFCCQILLLDDRSLISWQIIAPICHRCHFEATKMRKRGHMFKNSNFVQGKDNHSPASLRCDFDSDPTSFHSCEVALRLILGFRRIRPEQKHRL